MVTSLSLLALSTLAVAKPMSSRIETQDKSATGFDSLGLDTFSDGGNLGDFHGFAKSNGFDLSGDFTALERFDSFGGHGSGKRGPGNLGRVSTVAGYGGSGGSAGRVAVGSARSGIFAKSDNHGFVPSDGLGGITGGFGGFGEFGGHGLSSGVVKSSGPENSPARSLNHRGPHSFGASHGAPSRPAKTSSFGSSDGAGQFGEHFSPGGSFDGISNTGSGSSLEPSHGALNSAYQLPKSYRGYFKPQSSDRSQNVSPKGPSPDNSFKSSFGDFGFDDFKFR